MRAKRSAIPLRAWLCSTKSERSESPVTKLTRRAAQREFDERARLYRRANAQITELLEALLDDLSRRYDVREGLMVIGEPKSFDSFYRKATRKYDCKTVEEAFDRVHDLSRVRVVCHTLDDCYRIVKMLDEQGIVYVDPTTVEDYIKTPSSTGYRAIHLEATVDVPSGSETVGIPVEVQIRSALQEAWGHFTHGDFYHGSSKSELVGRLMRELSDLLYWSDRHAAQLVEEITKKPSPRTKSANSSTT
jgi:ppGpp synthetase/RelA/SpoT-type nucleotidyltranferase